jgi:hypothetical protein
MKEDPKERDSLDEGLKQAYWIQRHRQLSWKVKLLAAVCVFSLLSIFAWLVLNYSWKEYTHSILFGLGFLFIFWMLRETIKSAVKSAIKEAATEAAEEKESKDHIAWLQHAIDERERKKRSEETG